MLTNIAKVVTGAVTGVMAMALASTVWAGPTLLLDASDGLILYAEDYDNQWHPASLTKIMTAYVIFESLREARSSSTPRSVARSSPTSSHQARSACRLARR
jgi:D-alanyl-D-alanine carboxypeptidase